MKPLLLAALVLFVCAGTAAAQNGNGTITADATSSSYLDVSIGGSAVLTGDVNGGVTGTMTSGAPLNIAVDFGEIGPSNPNSFVKVAVPLRLQSNVPYQLGLAASASSNTGLEPLLSDFGVGFGAPDRNDTGVAAGTDSVTAAVDGDPSGESEVVSGGRWDWAPGRSLAAFETESTVLSGDRIMDVVPPDDAGLRVTAYVAVKPQFFTPKSFSTTLTFTIAAGS